MNSNWQPIVTDDALRQRIYGIVQETADRIYDGIEELTTPSLANGTSGVALLLAYLDSCFPNEGRLEQAYSCLVRSLNPASTTGHFDIGLYSGLSGLAWTISYVSGNSAVGSRMVDSINQAISSKISANLAFDDVPDRLSESQYDIIDGASGVGLHLLDHMDSDNCRSAVDAIVRFTVWLSGVDIDEPRTFVVPEMSSNEERRHLFTKGWWDFGLAHGAPGPLVFLAKAKMKGVGGEMSKRAIASFAHWLNSHKQYDRWGVNWPAVCGPQKHSDSHTLSRAAWCYGAPGISRALWMTGLALDDEELKSIALEAMQAVCLRPRRFWGSDPANLCHGLAGVLIIALRFYNETRMDIFRQLATSLVHDLAAEFDSQLQYGFLNKGMNEKMESTPTFLMGSGGVCLALASSISSVPPDWDAVLAIS